MAKSIELIVARDVKYGIGLDGRIPWRCKADMMHFKRVTTERDDMTKRNAVIMGRKTWESLKGKPLVDRVNICLSSSPQSIVTCSSIEGAIAYCNENPVVAKIFIIGGEQVYREALTFHPVSRIWMTVIKREFPTDRDVKFLASHLKRYNTSHLIADTEEYSIWKYE